MFLLLSQNLLISTFTNSSIKTFKSSIDIFSKCNCVARGFYILLYIYNFDPSSFLAYQNSWTQDASVERWVLDARHQIVDHERWILDAGPWALDSGRWTLDAGSWTLDFGRWALDAESWIVDHGYWLWTLDHGYWLWTLDAGLQSVKARLWTLESGLQTIKF